MPYVMRNKLMLPDEKYAKSNRISSNSNTPANYILKLAEKSVSALLKPLPYNKLSSWQGGGVYRSA